MPDFPGPLPEKNKRSEEMEYQFNRILLEPVQEELLISIVEAARNVPVEERESFLVARLDGADLLMHRGLKKNEKIHYGDVKELERQGLLSIESGSGYNPNFDVTSLGFLYYQHLKKNKGEAVERVASHIRDYLDAPEFKTNYPEAFAKWSQAEDLLWGTDTPKQLTAIGHHCREAVQEFAKTLVERYHPPDVTHDKTKTLARLRAVLELKATQLGKTNKDFLETLLAYWGKVNDLIQRQEHGSQREGEQLLWKDARRVVFQTMAVIFEIDSTL